MIPAFSFIGPHNVGKTTVLVEVIKVLKEKGLKVGVIKSSKDPGPNEKLGSDTSLYQKIGVEKVIFWGKEKLVLFQKSPLKDDFSFWYLIFSYFSHLDLVLVEGLKNLLSVPKIEVLRKDQKEPPFFQQGITGVIAVVADYHINGFPCFDIKDYTGIANFLLKRIPKYRSKIELIVDGRPIGLTRFVERALYSTIMGFIKTLRGVVEPREVEIRLIDI